MLKVALFSLVIAWSLSAATLLGYALNAPRLRLIYGDTPMAFNTAICLFCLATAGLVMLYCIERSRSDAG